MVWGNDTKRRQSKLWRKGSGLPKKRTIQDEFKLIDDVIALCKQGFNNRQIMKELDNKQSSNKGERYGVIG